MICVLNVIVACVLYNLSWRKTLRFFLCYRPSNNSMRNNRIYVLLKCYPLHQFVVWFYYIDIVIFMTAFFIVVPIAQLATSKVVRASPLHVTKFYILPMIGMALGIAFVDIHFSKTYRVEKDGSLIKYSQRLIVYSLLTDGFLGKQLYFLMNYF